MSMRHFENIDMTPDSQNREIIDVKIIDIDNIVKNVITESVWENANTTADEYTEVLKLDTEAKTTLRDYTDHDIKNNYNVSNLINQAGGIMDDMYDDENKVSKSSSTEKVSRFWKIEEINILKESLLLGKSHSQISEILYNQLSSKRTSDAIFKKIESLKKEGYKIPEVNEIGKTMIELGVSCSHKSDEWTKEQIDIIKEGIMNEVKELKIFKKSY